MRWLRKLWHRLTNLFRHRRVKTAPAAPITALIVDGLPTQLDANVLYLVGDEEEVLFAAMRCPCGCGATLATNLIPEAEPCWKWEVHADKTVSLHPSLWRTEGCRSHFLLRRGRIIWCEPAPPHARHIRVPDYNT